MDSQSKTDNPFDFSMAWSASAEDRLPKRSAELDLVKWLALALVTLGHARFVWPSMEWVSYPGRFAFVALCAVMAAHALRQGTPGRSAWRQIGLLVGAAAVSQWPFHALTGYEQGNIMVTLACAMAVMTGIRLPGWQGTFLATAGATLPLWVPMNGGFFAVLLPSAFLFALGGTWRRWPLPVALAALCQGADLWHPALAATSAVAVLAFLGRPRAVPALPRVGRWAYAYYPAHLAILALLIP